MLSPLSSIYFCQIGISENQTEHRGHYGTFLESVCSSTEIEKPLVVIMELYKFRISVILELYYRPQLKEKK